MKWGGAIIGGLILTTIGVGVWAAMRGKKGGPYEFLADPVYSLPEGLSPAPRKKIPYGAIEAVKRVHGSFRLAAGYIEWGEHPSKTKPIAAYYLVDTAPEGFDPVMFRVTEE